MVIQHNLTAMNSNRMLGVTTSAQAKSTEKLSSGYKINRAADDAAGLSISEKMRKQIRGLSQASLNAQDGISAVQTAEGALNEVQDMLQRMNELAVKASNGTMSENDRSYIQNEIDQLVTEIDRVAETTKFNETYLLKGDRDAERIATFSYAEAQSVEFGTNVTVLYGADGTAFKNAEALEKYLAENPDAKVYKSPASAAAGGNNTGVTEVTLKTGVKDSDLPTAETIYTYDGTQWNKSTTSTTSGPTPAAAAENADEEVKNLFNLKGTPKAGDTITFTPAVEATKGTDYIVTEATRGNTGNSAVTDTTSKDSVDSTDSSNGDIKYTSFSDENALMEALKDSTNQIYNIKESKLAEADDVSYVEADVTFSEGVEFSELGTVSGENVYTSFSSKDELLAALADGEKIYKGNNSTEATVVEAGEESDSADLVWQKEGVKYEQVDGTDKYEYSDFGLVTKESEEDGGESEEDGGGAAAKVNNIMQLDNLGAPVAAGEITVAATDSDSTAVTVTKDSAGAWDLDDAIAGKGTITIDGEDYVYASDATGTDGKFKDFATLQEAAKAKGYEITGTSDAAVITAKADDNTVTEDAAYYDADGNKIAANALSNYVQYDEKNNTVTFKADARPIYADKEATQVVTNDMLKDDIIVNKDDLVGSLELKLHVGADATANNQISVKLDAMSAKGLGVEGLKVDGANDTNALDAIETIREAIQKVSTQRSALGAVQNRLEHTINNLDNVVENTTAAESQIRDTDMATEMVKYSNNNILAQAGQAMLAQANQSNQGVLSLLG